jgi:hypothetical protein
MVAFMVVVPYLADTSQLGELSSPGSVAIADNNSLQQPPCLILDRFLSNS